jgi:tetratricopeptide (TPR) repeat protein
MRKLAATLILSGLFLPVRGAEAQPAHKAAENTGTQLAENGHCREAIPLLKKTMARATDKDLRKTVGADLVRCSMDLNSIDEAIATMRLLSREFPNDPQVLYLAVHLYSDVSIRASQELLFKAPASAQVHELNAESLETQGKWDEAAQEYRIALQTNPSLPGLHYRLGRLILSQPKTPTTMDDARREFEAELKINPENAGAEYVLGEMARQAEQWPDAIAHFTRATKLDTGFAEAFMGLGRSLLGADRSAEAVPALEAAARLQAANPETHFHLAAAYRRAGRKSDADREAMIHKQTSEKARATLDTVQKGVQGKSNEKAPE